VWFTSSDKIKQIFDDESVLQDFSLQPRVALHVAVVETKFDWTIRAAKLNYKAFHLHAHKTPACLLFPTEHIVNYLPTNLIIAANNRLSVRWLFISFTPFA
jgi:hypothetical protein